MTPKHEDRACDKKAMNKEDTHVWVATTAQSLCLAWVGRGAEQGSNKQTHLLTEKEKRKKKKKEKGDRFPLSREVFQLKVAGGNKSPSPATNFAFAFRWVIL